ncbi:Serine/threonine protein kinase [Melia azedarach]|uniref:Serine/threonine protein kinase n=1 Tax=Melia azedarach TaxID=155640 RepID=A0ACC1YX28_MELAZ|nr:Serine/threonine protein kinase [Melia azedarach]
MQIAMEGQLLHVVFLLLNVFILLNVVVPGARAKEYVSAVGDPGMRRDGLRVAFEAWNFCNEVGQEAPGMGSPRAADCFDLSSKHNYHRRKQRLKNSSSLIQKVSEADNKLGVGKTFHGLNPEAVNNPDLYATEKELYLGALCQVEDNPKPWQFWMVMLKNGNYDTRSGLCPENGKPAQPFNPGRFPCFGKGCMNQPILCHQPTQLLEDGTMRGSFNGTYDLGADIGAGLDGISFYQVVWEKKVGVGSWVFRHKLKTSKKYPWLMLYLRADATKGYSGGYHYDTRGMLQTLPESPNFKVRITLDVKQGGGPKSQFYLLDIGSCWKNNGKPCDGDVTSDVTRYSEMIINPQTQAWCSPRALKNCPPYHVTPNNIKIYRNDTANFPYGAYHYYCAPGNAQHLKQPVDTCDPYSNPQAQEIVQLLPHPIWSEYGYPTKQGEGWEGDGKTWELDVGGLSSKLYFYQDPGTPPARRIWTSIDMGTEIFVSDKDEVAEWTLSDFDVLLT